MKHNCCHNKYYLRFLKCSFLRKVLLFIKHWNMNLLNVYSIDFIFILFFNIQYHKQKSHFFFANWYYLLRRVIHLFQNYSIDHSIGTFNLFQLWQNSWKIGMAIRIPFRAITLRKTKNWTMFESRGLNDDIQFARLVHRLAVINHYLWPVASAATIKTSA